MKLYRWSQNPKSTPKAKKMMMMRRATTKATTQYGTGGAKKTVGAPKKITLPKLKFMEDDVEPDYTIEDYVDDDDLMEDDDGQK